MYCIPYLRSLRASEIRPLSEALKGLRDLSIVYVEHTYNKNIPVLASMEELAGWRVSTAARQWSLRLGTHSTALPMSVGQIGPSTACFRGCCLQPAPAIPAGYFVQHARCWPFVVDSGFVAQS